MESPTRPPTGSSGVRTAAAKEYVGRLQATLSGDAYAKFVGIMARFKARQLTKRGLVSEMDDLFSDLDRPDLLAGFDVFLPHGVSVDQIREQNSKCSTYSTDTAAARASLTLATASVSTAPPTTLSLQPHSQVSVIHENTSPPLPLAPAAEPPKQVTRQSAENNLHKETISLSESGSIGSSLWFATQGSTSTQQASASVPEPSSHADQLDALTCKVQLRFVEMGTPEKYQDFLNLMAESKLRPSSYPAAIYQATQLLRDQPDLLAEFKRVLASVSFAGLLPPGANTVEGRYPAFAASGRRGSGSSAGTNGASHRKSKSLSSWGVAGGSAGLGGGGGGVGSGYAPPPPVGPRGGYHAAASSGNRRSVGGGIGLNWEEGATDARSGAVAVAAESATRSAGAVGSGPRIPSGVSMKGNASDQVIIQVPLGTVESEATAVNERTPLLMTYEDWCTEHARRAGNSVANVQTVMPSSASGDGAESRRAKSSWVKWIWRTSVTVVLVGAAVSVALYFIL